MDIIEILQKPEFKNFYKMSKKIFTKSDKYDYHSAISTNIYKDKLYSLKFYFGTFNKFHDLSDLEKYFDKEDIISLYNVWDIENLDNKGLSFCIKYYPEKNEFKYQIHCKVKEKLNFKNVQLSHKDCRYGIGVEQKEKKCYTNLTNLIDKINVSKYFNIPDLVFFDEIEYCEFDQYSKVITCYSNTKRKCLDNLISQYYNDKYPGISNAINVLNKEKNLHLKNIGFYKDLEMYSLYFYGENKNGVVDAYEQFVN